MDQKTVG